MNLLRLKAVKDKTGLSGSTLWRLEKKNLFPGRKKISSRCVAWVSEEIDVWIKNQCATNIKPTIQELANNIHERSLT